MKKHIDEVNETKHTSGPWFPRGGNSRDPIPIETNGPSPTVICRVERIGGIGGNGADNARLIAAAPELLEALDALKKAVEAHEKRTGVMQMHPAIETARAAIAKASQVEVRE